LKKQEDLDEKLQMEKSVNKKLENQNTKLEKNIHDQGKLSSELDQNMVTETEKL
jgi:hypothetical protein